MAHRLKEFENMPVVVLISEFHNVDISQKEQLGVLDILSKPINITSLYELLEDAVNTQPVEGTSSREVESSAKTERDSI